MPNAPAMQMSGLDWLLLCGLSLVWGGSYFFAQLAVVTFLIPVSAIFLAIAVLGEMLPLRHSLGMGLIGLGLMVIDGRLRRRLRR